MPRINRGAGFATLEHSGQRPQIKASLADQSPMTAHAVLRKNRKHVALKQRFICRGSHRNQCKRQGEHNQSDERGEAGSEHRGLGCVRQATTSQTVGNGKGEVTVTPANRHAALDNHHVD